MMLDGLDAEGGRDMRFASARATDKHDVLRPIHELASVQLAHRGFVDLAGGEVEAGDVLVGREASGLHVIGDGADLALGHLGLQQLGQDGHGRIKGRSPLLDQVRDGLGHAIHLQAPQHDDDGSTCGIMTHGDLLRSGRVGHHSVRHWPWVHAARSAPVAYRCRDHRSSCRRSADAAGSAHASWSPRPHPGPVPQP